MLVYRCLQRVTPLRLLAQATSPLRRIGCVTAICATQPRLKTWERTSGWVVGDFLPLSPSSSPRLTLLLHPRFAHSFPCSSFRFPLNLAVKSGRHYIRFQRCPAKKMTAMVTKVGGGPNTLGPRDLPPRKLEGTRPMGAMEWLRL